jgi:exoribonuclease II
MLYKNKAEERIAMKAIALCFKPYLKPEEAMIYCNLESSKLMQNCKEFGIFKTDSGYYRKEDLDRMMEGHGSLDKQAQDISKGILGTKKLPANGRQTGRITY